MTDTESPEAESGRPRTLEGPEAEAWLRARSPIFTREELAEMHDDLKRATRFAPRRA